MAILLRANKKEASKARFLMEVSEVIKLLKTYPPDAQFRLWNYDALCEESVTESSFHLSKHEFPKPGYVVLVD
jgi:hypothetical protein